MNTPQIVLFPFERKAGKVSYSLNRFINWDRNGAFVIVESMGLVITPSQKLQCVPRHKVENGIVMVPSHQAKFMNLGDEFILGKQKREAE